MRHSAVFITAALLIAGLSACQADTPPPAPTVIEEQPDPAEIAIGERLFLETRFAQFFAANGEINQPLKSGDAVMAASQTIDAPMPGPFSGKAMNCAACHLVDQHVSDVAGRDGMRGYNDFARVSPIPARGDGHTSTIRNSPTLVNISQPTGSPLALHADGEFTSLQALVGATLTGRNYGWLASEQRAAVKHIANVIRRDNGSGELAQEFGGAYRDVLSANRDKVAEEFILPKAFTINLDDADDAEIVGAVSRLIAAYTDDLAFEKISPYDAFLAKNKLPAEPQTGESQLAYSQRLLQKINSLNTPQFIRPTNSNKFEFHEQPFAFGEQELAGLKLFFTESGSPSAGNCIACHAAPNFTDGGLHNTGASQHRYDNVHGTGAFMQLPIPELAERNSAPQNTCQCTPRS